MAVPPTTTAVTVSTVSTISQSTTPSAPPSSSSSSPPSSSSSPSSSSASSSSSSSTSVSSSAVPTTSSTALTSAAPAPLPTSSITSVRVSTGAGGTVITITSVIAATPTRNIEPTSSGSASPSKPFFQNKAAVAGVFSVVGLVVLGLLIALATNAIRRRRAEKFDRDVAEAAREAAAANVPVFDEDYGSGGGGGYTNYSDASSHGTYGKQPMAHHGMESYGMSEMRPYDSFPASGVAVGAGTAGIGASALARARSKRSAPDSEYLSGYDGPGYDEGLGYGDSQPYPRFAGPGAPQPHEMYNVPPQDMYNAPPHEMYNAPSQNARYNLPPTQPDMRNRNDILDAAGFGAAGANSAHGSSLHTPQSLLSRSLSKGTSGAYSTPEQESYAAHYQPGFKGDAYQASPPEHADPYGGYDEHAASGAGMAIPMAQPHSPGVGTNLFGDRASPHSGSADSASEYEEEEEEPTKRILKVANE